jgi:hypothetical protein
MEKFSMFDVIEKLAPLEKVVKSLNLFDKKEEKTLPKQNANPPKKTSPSAIYNYINKHNEISKRIDLNNKN